MNQQIYNQTKSALLELIEKAKLIKGQTVIVGCSTSEVLGAKIGTESSPETAEAICAALLDTAKAHGIYIGIQCCEHLNRAVVLPREAAGAYEEVNVVPQPKAGGSLASAAYKAYNDPVVVEEIKADAGLDIGFTLIGMHLRRVAVPLRLENDKIGEAKVLSARTRPKFIGGCRAVYDEAKQ